MEGIIAIRSEIFNVMIYMDFLHDNGKTAAITEGQGL